MSGFAPPKLWLSLYDIILWNMVVNPRTMLLVRFVFGVRRASFAIGSIEVFGVLIVRDSRARRPCLYNLFIGHIEERDDEVALREQ